MGTLAADPDIALFIWAPVEHPDLKGALSQIDAIRPGLPVMALLPRRNARQETAATQAGARGIIWPGMTDSAVIDAVRLVLGGDHHTLPAIENPEEPPPNGFPSALAIMPASARSLVRRYRLTTRQAEVLLLIGEGLTNKNIARRLGLQEGTVKVHLRQILRQLGVTNRTQAALLVRERSEMGQSYRPQIELRPPSEAPPPEPPQTDNSSDG